MGFFFNLEFRTDEELISVFKKMHALTNPEVIKELLIALTVGRAEYKGGDFPVFVSAIIPGIMFTSFRLAVSREVIKRKLKLK